MSRGRPRQYSTAAQKQRAYRERAKAARDVEKLTIKKLNNQLAQAVDSWQEATGKHLMQLGYATTAAREGRIADLEEDVKELRSKRYEDWQELWGRMTEVRQELQDAVGKRPWWADGDYLHTENCRLEEKIIQLELKVEKLERLLQSSEFLRPFLEQIKDKA